MKDPAVLWYWNDWSGGTITLTHFLKGCYMSVLNAQFNSSTGSLTIEEIKTVLGTDFEASWPGLQKKFKILEDGSFQNERLMFEKTKRQKYGKSRRDNASKAKELVVVNLEDIYKTFSHLTITKQEVEKIKLLGYNISQIDFILGNIENYRANTKYVSLYLTCINWLKNEFKDAKTPATGKKRNILGE